MSAKKQLLKAIRGTSSAGKETAKAVKKTKPKTRTRNLSLLEEEHPYSLSVEQAKKMTKASSAFWKGFSKSANKRLRA